MKNTTTLFEGKATVYARFRPRYPSALFDFLAGDVGLKNGTVADIGAGTGIFSRRLAPFATRVYAVEPNADMRRTMATENAAFPNIEAVDGDAAATGLASASVDAVLAAQAYHWFEEKLFFAEARRILRPGGRVFLIWNVLEADHPAFTGIIALTERLGIVNQSIRSTWLDRSFKEGGPFAAGTSAEKRFENPVSYTRERFIGHSLSTSYAPGAEAPCYNAYIEGVAAVFDTLAENGELRLPYQTRCYYGAP